MNQYAVCILMHSPQAVSIMGMICPFAFDTNVASNFACSLPRLRLFAAFPLGLWGSFWWGLGWALGWVLCALGLVPLGRLGSLTRFALFGRWFFWVPQFADHFLPLLPACRAWPIKLTTLGPSPFFDARSMSRAYCIYLHLSAYVATCAFFLIECSWEVYNYWLALRASAFIPSVAIAQLGSVALVICFTCPYRPNSVLGGMFRILDFIDRRPFPYTHVFVYMYL